MKKRFPTVGMNEIENLAYVTIYHYWVYGASTDEYFYYDFANKTHEEKLQYMTFRLRLIYVDHINDASKKKMLFNKYDTYLYFRDYFKRDVIQCSSDKDYLSFLEFVSKHTDFVVKPIDMSGGRGVHKSSVNGLDIDEKKRLFYSLIAEAQSNIEKYKKGMETSVVLEELIDQDDRMSVFNRQSINGVRICSILQNDDVMIYQSWLKIGRGGHFLTSAVFGTMDAGINPVNGIVDSPGMTETGEVWQQHPDNNINIEGFVIPRWEELVAIVKECARKVPFFKYVAWDFALSRNGWCMMEANYSGDFMWQLYRSRGMKKEFENLIGWKCDKEFWWEYEA